MRRPEDIAVAVRLGDLDDVIDRIDHLPTVEQPHPDTIRRLKRASSKAWREARGW